MRSASQPSENCDGEMLTEILIAGSQSREASKAARMICSDNLSITPISSAIGMKRSGGMIPASGCRQRASTSNPVISLGTQVYLRLEEGQELLMLEAEANALLDFAMGQQSPFHRGIEPDRADGPARLGMVECDVGAAEQVRHADLRRGGGGHAGESADLDHLAVDLERTRRQSKQPLDHLFRLLAAIGGKKARNGELVAARACDHGALARILEDGAGHAAKQRIAGVIAVPVVDRPEAVKLQRNDQQ